MSKAVRSVLILAILVGFLFAGAGSLSGCTLLCDVGKYRDTVNPHLQEWDDAVKLANGTPRMALAVQIEKMQAIRREVATLEIQSCLKEAHGKLLDAMDLQIDGFISFLKQDPDAIVNNYFTRSDQALQEWTDALAKK